MLIVRFARVIGIALLLGACASSGGGNGGTTRDRTTLTAADLKPYVRQNLFEVISRERPAWLATRGTAGLSLQDPEDIMVYLNGSRMGGRDHLRQIAADVVESVRFLSGPEAQSRYGMNHQYGAIVVTTLKR